jgi:acetyl-CoA carboxylase carboxyl transferase subunit alpha
LWKSAEFAAEAAEAMGVTAARLKELDLVDTVINEPLGGAHRNVPQTAQNIKVELLRNLDVLKALSTEDLLEQRYRRLTAYVRD